MSNAKGSDQNNKISQPVKVTAQSRSETNASATQDLRAQVQKLVVMPAAAVRAALANSVVGAVAAKVAYDIQAISRYLSFLESGSVLDKATLKPIKAKADTARAGDSVKRAIGKAYRDILVLNEVVTRIISKKFTETQRAIDSKSATLSKPKSDTSRGTDAASKLVLKSIVTTYYSGRWTDPAELTYGLTSFDQEVVQGFPNITVEGVTFSDRIDRVVSYKRSPADVARGSDSDVISVNKILPVPTFNSLVTGDLLSYDGYGITTNENLFTPTKEDFSDPYWNASNLIIRSVNELAPDGSYTATKLEFKNQYDLIGRNGLKLTSGQYYTFSVYAKCDDTIRYIALVCAESSNSFANFRVDSGGPSYGGGINYSYTLTPAANGFFRCSITFLATTTTHNPSIWMGGYQGSFWPVGDNYSMTLWGPKIELGSIISMYQPRSNSTLQNKNLITFSNEIGAYDWTLTSTNYNSYLVVSPNGSTDYYSLAWKIYGYGGVTNRKSVYKYVYLTAGVTYTFSIYLKQAGFTNATIWFDTVNLSEGAYYGAACLINLTNGTRSGGTPTATTVTDVGNGWYRCSVTATATVSGYTGVQTSLGDPNGVGTAIGDNFSGVYIWGAQLEQGSSATTYHRVIQQGQLVLGYVDLGTNNNNGTISSTNTSTLPIPNPAGYVTFNPAYQHYVYTDRYVNYPGPQTFSVAVAFRTSVASGAKLIGFQNSQFTGASNYDRQLVIGTDGIVRFGVYNSFVSELPSGSSLADGKWHYVVGTFSSGVMTLYVDGLKVNSRTLVGQTIPQSYSGYWIVAAGSSGGWTAGSSAYYTGDIAKAEVYSTALSATQVQTQYNLLANRLGLAQRSADPATINDAPAKSISRTMASFYNTSYTTDIFGDLTLGSSTANEDIAQQFPTTRPETLSLSELKSINFGKVTADIFSAGDLTTRLFTKKIIDFISAIHDIDLPYNNIKGRGDISSITESITKIKNFVRAYNDTSRATDAISKKDVTKGPRNDTARATDAIVRSALFNRSYADSERTADLFSRVVTYNRSKADVARGTDAVGKYYTKSPFNDTSKALDSIKRTISLKKTDIARGTDSFSKLVSFNRSFSSTATSTHSVDIISTTKSYIRTFVQTAKSQDTVSRVWVARRPQAEIQKATDAFTKVVTYNRSKADVARGTDVFVKVVSYNRPKADTVGVVQTFKRTFSKPKTDTARSTDAITAKVFTKRLADVIKMADYLYVSGFTHPGTLPPVDQQRVRDTFYKIVTFVRNQSEIVRGTDTLGKSTGKVLGDFDYKVWSDYTDTTELVYAYDLLQNYTDFRTEYTKPTDSNSKAVSKVFNATTTYYRNSTFTDYAELTFGQTAAVTNDDPAFATTPAFDQDLFMSFAAAYTDAKERATATDLFTKVLSAVRNTADTAAAPDTTGRSLQRSVGDNINRVFNDVAELFYANEFYSDAGGVNAKVLITVVPPSVPSGTPTYALELSGGGVNYTAGQQFTILTQYGNCSFSASTVTVPFTSGSIALNGTNQYLTVPNNVNLQLSTNAFTIEAWIYKTADFVSSPFISRGNSSSLNGFSIRVEFYPNNVTFNADAGAVSITSTGVVPINTWTHVAVVREGTGTNQTKIYINGILSGTGTCASNFNQAEPVRIGSGQQPSYGTFPGNLTNVRIVNGSAVYTSAFTPPTAPLTAVTNTQLLLLTSTSGALLTDSSTNNFTVTNVNSAPFSALTPLIPSGSTGTITSLSAPTGTPSVVSTVTQSAFWTDYTGDLTLGSSTANQEFVQTSAIVTNYTYPSSGSYFNIGSVSNEAKRNVVGQELLFTLIPRSDGDLTRSLDAVGKRIDKQARQYMPQGFWNDFAELSFATGFDQDLLQTLVTSQPETFNVLDVMSRVTLGPIKGVTDIARATELPAKKLSKGTKADSAGAADTFPKTYSISAGQYSNRIWRDYNEIADMSTTFSIFAEIPLVYEGKYELIQLPETFAKNFTKVLTFPFYTWRDFNELTFGTLVDEEITFTWSRTDYTEISRVMDDARRFIQPNKSDIALVPDPLGKLVSKPTVGDTVVNDSLTYNPEYIEYFSLADESLRANYPDYKIDKVTVLEAFPKTISKRILNPGPIIGQNLTGYELTNFDETVLTYGYVGYIGNQTFPDVKFVNYDEDFYISEDLYTETPYGSDSALASDIFLRATTTLRTFAETIHVADYTLIQKNGGPYFTQIRNNIDVAKSADTKASVISKSAGDNQSFYSLWYDFAELDLSLELTQYLLRPSDSAVDIGHLADVRTNKVTKNAGKINDIWNSFDTDIFFNEDLVQIFDESYRTEIILLGETIGLKPNKPFSESPRLQDSLGKFYNKTSVGDYNVTTDGVTYSPDYLAYYDYEEFLGAAYPNHKIDLVLLAESKPIKYNKAAGLTQYYKNVVNYNDELTSFDYTLNAFNEILLYDMPARSIYNKYLDSLVFDELEEQLRDSVRDDPITAVEDFLRVLTYRRTNSDIAKAVELAAKALSKGTKADTARAAETSTRQYTINAGKLFYIWSDFNELSFGGSPAIGDQDLLQQLPWNRFEYLTMVENFAKNLSRKASPDTARAADSRTLQPNKGLSENSKAQDLPGKFLSIAQVGNSTSTFWVDLGEITTYDETLFTYGYMKTTKFDNVTYLDGKSLNYTINPGNYRARVWNDFAEVDYYNEITQNYIPYVTELILPAETLTKSLNKVRTELPRATDAGYARKFDSGAYVIDSSPYFASDYTSDGVTTSTF